MNSFHRFLQHGNFGKCKVYMDLGYIYQVCDWKCTPSILTSSITWKRGWQVIRFPDFNILRFSSYPKWDEPERGGRLVILSLFCSAIGTKWYSFCLFKPSHMYMHFDIQIFFKSISPGVPADASIPIYICCQWWPQLVQHSARLTTRRPCHFVAY